MGDSHSLFISSQPFGNFVSFMRKRFQVIFKNNRQSICKSEYMTDKNGANPSFMQDLLHFYMMLVLHIAYYLWIISYNRGISV